jgi:hypothetical protein
MFIFVPEDGLALGDAAATDLSASILAIMSSSLLSREALLLSLLILRLDDSEFNLLAKLNRFSSAAFAMPNL